MNTIDNNLLPVPLCYTYPTILIIKLQNYKYPLYYVPELNRFVSGNNLSRILRINNINLEYWYCRWILKKEKYSSLCEHRYCCNKTKFISPSLGYKRYCCVSCAMKEAHYDAIFSEERRKKIGEGNSRRIWKEESKEKIRKTLFKNIIKSESRIKISKALKGRKQSEEHIKKRIFPLKGRKRPQETIIKAQISRKRNKKSRPLSAIESQRNKMLGRKATPQARLNLKLAKIKSWKNPSEKMKKALSKLGWGKKCSIEFRGELFNVDSTYEQRYVKILSKYFPRIISIIREPFSIQYKNPYDNLIHNYFPDFLVVFPNLDDLTDPIQVLIEIKPNRLLDDIIVKEKSKAAKEYCKNNGISSYYIITEDFLFCDSFKI